MRCDWGLQACFPHVLSIPQRVRDTFPHGIPPARSQGEGRIGALPNVTATAAFVPHVIRCASNPHFQARAASARALAALVPSTQFPGLISELLGGLPTSPRDAKCRGAMAHNHIHGEMFRLSGVTCLSNMSQVSIVRIA